MHCYTVRHPTILFCFRLMCPSNAKLRKGFSMKRDTAASIQSYHNYPKKNQFFQAFSYGFDKLDVFDVLVGE